MKKKIIIILTVLLIFTGINFSKKRKVDSFKYPKIKKINIPKVLKDKTRNGIRLRLMKTDKLPLVNIVALLKGGSVYDPMDKISLASMTAQLLRIGGTVEMNGEQLDAFLDSNGISISINSSFESFSINMSCLDENLEEGIKILSKILITPRFDKKKLEEIKTQFYSSIQRRNDSPQPILSREFDKVIYGENTPFSAVAEYEHIDNISINDIKTEYKNFFAPDNMLVGIAGPIDLNTLMTLFEKYFGNWKNKSKIKTYPNTQNVKNDFLIAFANKETLNQNYISIGHIGEKENPELEPVIKVFNSIFSQGMDSRLFNKVRTKLGLTYGISGGMFQNKWYRGKTYFSTFTKAESTIPVIKAIFEEIDKIKKEKVTEEELSIAKKYFLNSYVFKFSSPEKILFSKLYSEFYGDKENAQKELVDKIQKVTADDIYNLVNNYLHPKKMKIVIVGNKKLIKGNLSDLGKVKELDISIKPPVVKEKIPVATPQSLKKGKEIISRLFKNKYKGYKKIKGYKMSYDMTMNVPGRGAMTMGMETTMLYPDKNHTEISVMGFKMKRIVNGDKGIMFQMGRKIPISKKEIKSGKFCDPYDMYHNFKNYKFQYYKEVKIDKKVFDVVYAFNLEKDWKKLYINKKTGLIEITESISKQAPMIGLIKTIDSNFKTIKGIPFAFKSKIFFKGKVVRSMNIKKITVNPRIDKNIFKLK